MGRPRGSHVVPTKNAWLSMSDEGLSLGTEGRKFLRYVMPGLVFGVETLLLFYIAMPEEALRFLDKVSAKDASFGAIAGIFLASGGLGYIFASIHHWYLWRCEEKLFDHRPVLLKLKDKIPLNNDDLAQVNGIDTLKAREIAQSISLALWHYHVKLELPEKDHLDYLGNQAHGLGAARIASICALVTAVVLCIRHGGLTFAFCPTVKCDKWLTLDFALMIVFGGFIIYIFHTGYSRVARIAQRMYDKTLVDFIK
jgi:hypothetical protein